MTTTIAPKRTKKEPSFAKVARQYARGIKDVTPLAFDPFPDVELKADLQRLSDCPPPKLGIADQIWCGTTANQKTPLDGLKRDVAIKLIKQHLRGAKVEHAKANGNGHPALTGTTTPAGIMANDPDADGTTTESVRGKDGRSFRDVLRSNRPVPEDLAAAAATGAEVEIECERIQVNPDNDHAYLADEDVVALAESIAVDKLLQAITVRPTPLAGRENPQLKWRDFEIVCGERRWLACQKAGLATVRCKIRTDVDDAQALRLMVIENAKRRNVNPIVKARNIERLCEPTDEGGAGMTKDQAAQAVGLKDGSSASNLVRLLKLPKVWQDRVAAGELPESFARLIVPICRAPRLMEVLDETWKRDKAGRQHQYSNHWAGWDSRDKVEELVERIVGDCTRPLGKEKHNYRSNQFKIKGRNAWDFTGEHPRRFELTPEVEKTLDIVELTIDDKPVRMATNIQAYDKLQIPAIVAHVDKSRKDKAAKSGTDGKAEKRELSAAEKKANQKKAAEQLQARIDGWRHRLLLKLCAEAIEAGKDSGLRLVMAFACDHPTGDKDFSAVLQDVRKIKGDPWDIELWDLVGSIDCNGPAFIRELAGRILSLESSDPRYPVLEFELVEAYAADLRVDVAAGWRALQEARDTNPLLEEFYQLFQTSQLEGLADELGVHVGNVNGKDAKIKILLTRDRALKLPKCIKPLAARGKAKAKRGK